MSSGSAPEFSRPCAVDGLPAGGQGFALAATEAERAALARRFDLDALDRLEAEGHVQAVPVAGAQPLVEVSGRLRAAASQRCVVTLEPVPAALDTAFRRVFTRELPDEAAAAEVEVDALDDDEPEPLPPGETLDLGELVAEELAVALDPYPRSPDADAVLAEVGAGPEPVAAVTAADGGGGLLAAALAEAAASSAASRRRH